MDQKTISCGTVEEDTFDIVTALLEVLSDKQLSQLVVVIRDLQVKREDTKIEDMLCDL
jgi:hypothetical protein